MGEANGVAHVPVHDLHRQDRLRLSLDRFPCSDTVQEAPRPFGDRNRAQRACGCCRGGARIDDGDGDAFSHRLLDRGGERQSVRASAGDDDVVDGVDPATGLAPLGRIVGSFVGEGAIGGADHYRAAARLATAPLRLRIASQ